MVINEQKVFVPNYGAGIMTKVEDSKSYDVNKKYVNIFILIDNINLYIPEDRLLDYRIRNITSKENLDKAFDIIKSKPQTIEKKWSKRYKKNNDKIKEGDFFQMCEVIRDLYYLKSKGTIPPGERRILDKVENMVGSEIALLLGIKIEAALGEIRKLGK
ncbi:transcriptional regulator [Clostridium carboxidivorans P7]|uniref:Transcriptional regulator, CarD family n=1 Tax=Clostridium carboxidivorans P7 TaxID=536227 RepID=C6PZC6_9CLOT|nr:CarD family transcriptional regulator [Clostridium carboxidivorans]AKN33004.1 transcriptional regulator [Clostridium carboxidivorans P7]EET85406.1 transcriptional regulator, CarD family [Clostridium carboxidivorans P7]EFG87550.1 CarD-like transcriptional regulator [Clostridium carboxidivorans P7]